MYNRYRPFVETIVTIDLERTFWVNIQGWSRTTFEALGRKLARFSLSTMLQNWKFFEIWEVSERVCENPRGGGNGPLPPPPLADTHDKLKHPYFGISFL